MVERSRSKKAQKNLDLCFHALSDPSRRKIVELLRETKVLTVSAIAETFSMSLNGVSKHLKVLEAANLIERKIEGRVHQISLKWETIQIPYEWLHFYHHQWNSRLNNLIDYVSINKGSKT